MKLIIPSAKIVPEELQSLGKLPAVIYPINQGIVFDALVEQYREKVDRIDILSYEAADEVERRLSNYKNISICIKKLTELRDLGYTVLCGIDEDDQAVAINFGDTIVYDDVNKILNVDGFFYSEDYPSATWSFFKESNGKLTDIYDKQIIDNRIPMKLFVGVFVFQDAQYLKKCIIDECSKENSTNSFYRAIQKYSEKYKLSPVKSEHWFDIGHSRKYRETNIEVKARSFNHILIDKNRGILKKTSDDKDKFIGEVRWYLKLPTDIEYVRPRIFSYSTSYECPYVEMEYYDYHTVHELFLFGDLDSNQWRDIFKRIRFIYKDFKRYTVRDDTIREAIKDMYYTKTEKRLKKLKKQREFEKFYSNSIFVNNRQYVSLDEIVRLLKKIIPRMLYDVNEFNIIHGDLCFSNIMVDSNFSFIKVIDPRGKFGNYDIYGDSRYELAKLFHSVEGKYDFIIKDLFDIDYDIDKCIINYTINDRRRDYDIMEIFLGVFNKEIGKDENKIRLIEALLFLSMIPLHEESLKHQMAMLGTGLDLLNNVINITIE